MQLLIYSINRLGCLGLLRAQAQKLPLAAWAAMLFFSVSFQTGFAQQSISFNAGGYNYSAKIYWVVKQNGVDYQSKLNHSLDRAKDATIDLVVYFDFRYDSIPSDQNLVWGFQFSQEGGLLSPQSNDKRSRSSKLFQRFRLNGTGNASLLISPKIWRKNSSNQFEVIELGQPFKLNFNISDSKSTSDLSGKGSAASDTPSLNKLVGNGLLDVEKTNAPQEAKAAYTEAVSVEDSTQKIKALMSFADKYASNQPSAQLVSEAIKNVPLATSLPQQQSGRSFAYTLNYAVNPVIDTNSVRGWRWTLSESDFGKYQLILDYLGDSIHSFKIADLGKNAPFNQPRELRPFEKIDIKLVKETSESFQLRFEGGAPPFIVFLSQDEIPKARYVVDYTDTLWTIPKESCRLCKSGAHTLEVYSGDFTTLLLRADRAIHISRLNYFRIGLICIVLILGLFFIYKPAMRYRQRYLYEKQLRDIEAWEKED